jgi:hypothetical protein
VGFDSRPQKGDNPSIKSLSVAGIRELGFHFGDELAGLLNAESWPGVCDKPGINHHNFSAGFSGRERVTVHGNESGFQDRR